MDWPQFEQAVFDRCDAIEPALGRRLVELEHVREKGSEAIRDNRQNADALRRVSYGETALAKTQDCFGLSLLRMVLLQHDIEIAVADVFVETFIDLKAVFPPFEFPLNSHNIVRVRQDAPARLARVSAPPCMTLASSQFALVAPMSVALLGQSVAPSLHLPLQLSRAPGQPSWQRKFNLRPARGAILCPPDEVRSLFSGSTIDYRVRTVAVEQTAQLPTFEVDASFVDDIVGPCYLYASLATDNIGFFGTARHRPRGILPPLGRLPNWASAGIKLHQSLLSVQVVANAPLGARLTHFDADVASQLFRFGIAIEKERSWGGDLVRVTVGVRVTGQFNLIVTPTNPNRLEIVSEQQGDLAIERVKLDVEVLNTKVPLPGIDEIVDRLATELTQLLVRDLGDYSTRLDQSIPGCDRVDARVYPAALAIYVHQS